ncbi:MAG: hypothetical protein KAW42_04170 [Candidatus Atribacteria bacterium]|nr:hypothetical protein [Candidatus Atribacteria bacterium]
MKEIFTKIFGIKYNDNPKEIKKKIENKIKEIYSSLLFASSYFSRLLSSKIKSLEEIMEQSKEESNLLIRVVKKLLWSFSFCHSHPHFHEGKLQREYRSGIQCN